MPGLYLSLSMAARSLEAQRAGLDAAGQNIANLNTPGYSRRMLQLAEVTYGAGGVEVLGTRALRDAVLDARMRAAIPAESRERAVLGSLSLVETSIGAPGQGLDARLSAFFDAWSALSADPTSPPTRDAVVLQGRQLATAFNDLSNQLSSSARLADTGIRGAIDEVNSLSAKIASLNDQIATAGGGNVEALRDQQNLAIEQLSALTQVSVQTRKEGGVDVTIPSGRALVIGGSAYQVEVGTGANGYATLTLNHQDVTGEFTTGRIGGLGYARDTAIPGYLARLDDLAYQVAQQVNTLHQTGTDLDGNPGVAFFTPPAGVGGAARLLAMNPAVVANSNRVAASQSGAPGDNGIARSMAALRDALTSSGGTATFTQAFSQLAYAVGADVDTARAQQQSTQATATEVGKLRDQVSGVSLDEEAASMLKFQRAYEANAKYFTVVDSALQTLMSLVG